MIARRTRKTIIMCCLLLAVMLTAFSTFFLPGKNAYASEAGSVDFHTLRFSGNTVNNADMWFTSSWISDFTIEYFNNAKWTIRFSDENDEPFRSDSTSNFPVSTIPLNIRNIEGNKAFLDVSNILFDINIGIPLMDFINSNISANKPVYLDIYCDSVDAYYDSSYSPLVLNASGTPLSYTIIETEDIPDENIPDPAPPEVPEYYLNIDLLGNDFLINKYLNASSDLNINVEMNGLSDISKRIYSVDLKDSEFILSYSNNGNTTNFTFAEGIKIKITEADYYYLQERVYSLEFAFVLTGSPMSSSNYFYFPTFSIGGSPFNSVTYYEYVQAGADMVHNFAYSFSHSDNATVDDKYYYVEVDFSDKVLEIDVLKHNANFADDKKFNAITFLSNKIGLSFRLVNNKSVFIEGYIGEFDFLADNFKIFSGNFSLKLKFQLKKVKFKTTKYNYDLMQNSVVSSMKMSIDVVNLSQRLTYDISVNGANTSVFPYTFTSSETPVELSNSNTPNDVTPKSEWDNFWDKLRETMEGGFDMIKGVGIVAIILVAGLIVKSIIDRKK